MGPWTLRGRLIAHPSLSNSEALLLQDPKLQHRVCHSSPSMIILPALWPKLTNENNFHLLQPQGGLPVGQKALPAGSYHTRFGPTQLCGCRTLSPKWGGRTKGHSMSHRSVQTGPRVGAQGRWQEGTDVYSQALFSLFGKNGTQPWAPKTRTVLQLQLDACVFGVLGS